MEFQQSDLNYHGYKEYKYGEFGEVSKGKLDYLPLLSPYVTPFYLQCDFYHAAPCELTGLFTPSSDLTQTHPEVVSFAFCLDGKLNIIWTCY